MSAAAGMPLSVIVEAFHFRRAPKPEPGSASRFTRLVVCSRATDTDVADAARWAIAEIMRLSDGQPYDVGVTVESQSPDGSRTWGVTTYADENLSIVKREEVCAAVAFAAREAFDALPPAAYNYSPQGWT